MAQENKRRLKLIEPELPREATAEAFGSERIRIPPFDRCEENIYTIVLDEHRTIQCHIKAPTFQEISEAGKDGLGAFFQYAIEISDTLSLLDTVIGVIQFRPEAHGCLSFTATTEGVHVREGKECSDEQVDKLAGVEQQKMMDMFTADADVYMDMILDLCSRAPDTKSS